MKHKKVLVTGGAGFIGSHLVEALVNQGAQVTVLDNFSTGSLDNLAHLTSSITLISGDITNFNDCLKVTSHADIVFHLAAQLSVSQSITNPLHCHATNVDGTFNMLRASKEQGVRRFIFASSAAVYGNHEGICSENLSCKPTSMYGLSKIIGEEYCRMFSKLYNLPTICLRYFNVYGPRQRSDLPDAGFIARIRHQMAHNESITLYGTGEQTRDFVPVSTIVQANLLAATLDPSYCTGIPLNVASGKSASLLHMIDVIKKEFPHYAKDITFAPARTGDIIHSQADTKRLEKYLSNFQ